MMCGWAGSMKITIDRPRNYLAQWQPKVMTSAGHPEPKRKQQVRWEADFHHLRTSGVHSFGCRELMTHPTRMSASSSTFHVTGAVSFWGSHFSKANSELSTQSGGKASFAVMNASVGRDKSFFDLKAVAKNQGLKNKNHH
jgi:hypothetical protein